MYKIKYKNYVVNLFLPERRSGKVVLLLPGLPMSTNAQGLIQNFLETGAVVFYPYFSGSFDSGGAFSATSSIKDVAILHKLVHMQKVRELYFEKELELGVPQEVILAGMSYGAAIALLGHGNRYQKVILLSPALLFNSSDIGGSEGRAFQSQMKSLLFLLKKAHPYTYRTGLFGDLGNFLLGRKVDKSKIISTFNDTSTRILVLHGNRDTSIPADITRSIESKVTNKLIEWRYIDAEHSTSSYGEEALTMIRDFIEK